MASRLEIKNIRGTSRATTMVSEAPLKFIPTSSQYDEFRILTSSYGGGMLQFDRVEIDVCCHESASLFLGSQGNNHVYTSEVPEAMSCQAIVGDVEIDGYVVIAPEPTVLHKGARFTQYQTWNIEEGGSLFLLDWVHSGRSESGEQYEYDYFSSEIELSYQSKPIFLEKFVSNPSHEIPQFSSRFGPYQIMLTVYAYGTKAQTLFDACCEVAQNKEILRIHELPYESDETPPNVFTAHYKDDESGVSVLRVLGKTREDLNSIYRLIYTGSS